MLRKVRVRPGIGHRGRWVSAPAVRFRRSVALLLVALCASSIVTLAPVGATSAQSAPRGSNFVPVAPCRLVDTRQAGERPLAAGGSMRVGVTGRCGVPAGGGAVAVTITATDATTGGYITAHAASTPLPNASNVNYRPGAAVANSAIVALSGDGAIDLFASSEVAVIVDVTGVFVPVTAAVAAGRFVSVPPSRLVDTRLSADRRSGDLVVPLPAGVPLDATALAVSVTLTDTDQPSYVTVHPAGASRPNASVVNADPLERARAGHRARSRQRRGARSLAIRAVQRDRRRRRVVHGAVVPARNGRPVRCRRAAAGLGFTVDERSVASGRHGRAEPRAGSGGGSRGQRHRRRRRPHPATCRRSRRA